MSPRGKKSSKKREQQPKAPKGNQIPSSKFLQRPANAQPKKQPSKSPLAVRNVYSPLVTQPVPVSRTVGRAFHATGQITRQYSMSVRRLFVFAASPHSANAMIVFDELAPPNVYTYVVPRYDTSYAAGGPTSGRAMKSGCRLLNTTPRLSQGGTVHVLQSDSRFSLPTNPQGMSLAQVSALMLQIQNNPDVRVYNGVDFSAPRCLHNRVVDSYKYENFLPWAGTETVDDYASHIFTWPTLSAGAGEYNRPMSTTFVLFEATTTPQNWTITADLHNWLRWPQDHVAYMGQKDMPVVSEGVLSKLQATGSG